MGNENFIQNTELKNEQLKDETEIFNSFINVMVQIVEKYGNKSIKKRKDGSNYKDFYYYGCKHRNMTRGHKCDYKKTGA